MLALRPARLHPPTLSPPPTFPWQSTNAAESIDSLADEVAGWMGLPAMPSNQTVLVLPEKVSASSPGSSNGSSTSGGSGGPPPASA